MKLFNKDMPVLRAFLEREVREFTAFQEDQCAQLVGFLIQQIEDHGIWTPFAQRTSP